jgi:hypothetical protein
MSDDDERNIIDELSGAKWAFIWAVVTIAAIGLAALAGWAWRHWPWW